MKLFTFLLCLPFAAPGQTPASDDKTLQTLMSEVHQLRVALERSTQFAPRIQIAVERLKIQQEQVARVARQLDDWRRELDRNREHSQKVQQRLEQLSAAATSNTDLQHRKDFEAELSSFKLEAEQAEKSLQEMQVREAELANQLQSERAKLTDLNDRLDQIERSLVAP
jgi:predicted  nucleic acid-binding Zn-ribbon protein